MDMKQKVKLTRGDLSFTKAQYIKEIINRMDDNELNKLDLRKLEFQWQTMDVLRDAHPKPLSLNEIMQAIELKYEKVN